MRIFIVEDDPVMCGELKILLENAMYRTVVCKSYESAAREVSQCGPDLVLLDVNLPGQETGHQECDRLVYGEILGGKVIGWPLCSQKI